MTDKIEDGEPASNEETGWVIEHSGSEPSLPRYWGGVHGWTHDNLKAVRFVREIDAQSEAEHLDDDGVPENYRVAEHMWVGTRWTRKFGMTRCVRRNWKSSVGRSSTCVNADLARQKPKP